MQTHWAKVSMSGTQDGAGLSPRRERGSRLGNTSTLIFASVLHPPLKKGTTMCKT